VLLGDNSAAPFTDASIDAHGMGGQLPMRRYYRAQGTDDRPHGEAFYGTNGTIFSDRIVVNQRAYFHSRTYRVPRHVANSLSETMWRGHRHQEEVEGHSMTQLYQNARGTVLSPVRGTVNAPRRFDA
jgi:hypothetical protein